MKRAPTLGAAIVAAATLAASSAGAAPAVGRWVLVQRLTTSATVPVVGDIEAKTTIVSLHTVTATDAKMSGAGVLCSMAIDSGSSLVDTILPAAFQRALPPPMLDADLTTEGGVVRLRQATRWVVVGARISPVATAVLPRDARDSRVFDQDHDGRPGVTVRVEGLVNGELHVVQRSWSRLVGARAADGTFAGRVEFGIEQNVLGTTSSFLDDPPRSRPIVQKSWFRLARLGGEPTCDDARRAAKKWT